MWTVVVLICTIWSPGPKVPDEDREALRCLCWIGGDHDGGLRACPASLMPDGDKARADDAVQSPSSADTGHADGALLDLLKMEEMGADEWLATSAT